MSLLVLCLSSIGCFQLTAGVSIHCFTIGHFVTSVRHLQTVPSRALLAVDSIASCICSAAAKMPILFDLTITAHHCCFYLNLHCIRLSRSPERGRLCLDEAKKAAVSPRTLSPHCTVASYHLVQVANNHSCPRSSADIMALVSYLCVRVCLCVCVRITQVRTRARACT